MEKVAYGDMFIAYPGNCSHLAAGAFFVGRNCRPVEKVVYERGVSAVPPTLFLICWLISSDVSVSALRAGLMADGVFAGTVVVVEKLVIFRPANSTLPTLAATEENPVVGLAKLESV